MGLLFGGEVDLYNGDRFFAGDPYAVARACGVFGEENQTGADSSRLAVACLDFSFAGYVYGEDRMVGWTPIAFPTWRDDPHVVLRGWPQLATENRFGKIGSDHCEFEHVV